MQRVDEADEMPISKVEPQAKEPRGENYDTQIIPCYKEAVLTAWNAYEGFTSHKTRSSSTDVHNELARVRGVVWVMMFLYTILICNNLTSCISF